MKTRGLLILCPLFALFGCKKDLPTMVEPSQINKTISLIRKGDISTTFDGYRVDPNARKLGKEYWANVPVVTDIITYIFNKNIDNINPNWDGFTTQQVAGDFNNDGWIDIFNPGCGKYAGKPTDYYGFYIWNPTSKTFDTWDLITNITKKYFGQNQYKSIPVYLNGDNYIDIVIYDTYDETGPPISYEPIRILLSDGKGGYELKDISFCYGKYNHSGDIGDIDGDGLNDIVVCTGKEIAIGKGINSFPYFDTWKTLTVPVVPEQTYFAAIKDVNADGKKDLILGSSNGVKNRVLIQDMNGEFTKSILLPDGSDAQTIGMNLDYIVDDFNGDGNLDIAGLINNNYACWSVNFYIKKDNAYVVDNSFIQYAITPNRFLANGSTNWKSRFIYQDFNNDGRKDIMYINCHSFDHSLYNKTIFINKDGKFVEDDFYKYDTFLSQIRKY